MGAPWAPAYACLHLGWWEENVMYTSPMYLGHARLWLRYIDDVLMLWEGSKEDLSLFLDKFNCNTKNIRLTYVADTQEMYFLDLPIRLENGSLSTQTFRKSMDANTLLHASSHHPKSLIRVSQWVSFRESDVIAQMTIGGRQMKCTRGSGNGDIHIAI